MHATLCLSRPQPELLRGRRWLCLASYGVVARLMAGGGDGSRLLGLKFLSDLVFLFIDIRRRLRDGCAWRGETAPPPWIYLPLGRWDCGIRGSIFSSRRRRTARILEDGVVNCKKGLWWHCTAEPYFPVPVTVLWSSRWYGSTPPEAVIWLCRTRCSL